MWAAKMKYFLYLLHYFFVTNVSLKMPFYIQKWIFALLNVLVFLTEALVDLRLQPTPRLEDCASKLKKAITA